ncbi:ABC transporter ATP-binding protein [Salinibacterium hongtaonis]|uniref:ABC transporter ATP-binding protein n=1 Tax=Homoserinimonas hongtaonis TaxID=2079791 RepID=UPI000D333FFF|nr:ABC transporter ATP-binding protein [Salinibacterium hongtaonis]AWB88602.1 polyamine ABC transporter ATP-binding protein [Salinibacterium hongtaonis]
MTIPVTIDKVDVTLGPNHVLKQVCLDVKAGEFVTLLGASGSGKSTLLNVIAGLQKVDTGHVLFNGENVEKRAPQDRNVGVVFQSYALFPHMTIGDNVSFPLLAAKRPVKERKAVAAEMLELVQLGGMADRMPASLSGGQRQRVALARAIASNPGVLLLDEPMAALDKQLREHMQVEIKRIQERVGITTIAVTHDQTEAFTMSDRVAIMHQGCFVQIDAPQELYRKPVNEYVAKFLGEANLFGTADGVLLGQPGTQGSQGTAVIRPEDLQPLHDGETARVSIEATVSLVSFQGERYRVEARAADGTTVISTMPSNSDMSRLAVGSLMEFGCRQPERMHVIVPQDSSAVVEEPVAA